jgi:quercetin dioxygenase-like cupin family protein
MCKITEEEIREKLKDLPETPSGLIAMLEPGDFHGIVEWKVVKGQMLSFKEYEHINSEVYHTRFSKDTEVCWHTHGESREIIICLSGEITLLFEDGSQIKLKETDDYKIDKHVKHMAIVSNNPCEILAITIPKER